jgi:hypothetical protein
MTMAAQHASRSSIGWSLAVVVGPLLATTVLAKWAAPLGRGDIAMSWPLIYLVCLAGLAFGGLELDRRRLPTYLLVVAVLGVLQVLHGEAFSLPSFLFMATIYLMYAVGSPNPSVDSDRALRFFGALATFLAVCGIVQFLAQFVFPPHLAFPIENLLPESVVISGYNMQAPLAYGSALYRSNGIFLLEPSFYSQLLGIAIVVELCGANRRLRLALYAAALVVSYSGTGLVILAICLPVLVLQRRRWGLVLAAVAVLALLGAFARELNLDVFLERADELQSPKSSGFERFVGGFYLFEQFLWHDPWRTLWGAGAGAFVSHAAAAALPASEIAHAKIIFEFGLVGAAVHFGFLIYCIAQSPAPAVVRLAVLVAFFMGGLYTAASHGLALSLLVWPAALRRAPESSVRARTTAVSAAPSAITLRELSA